MESQVRYVGYLRGVGELHSKVKIPPWWNPDKIISLWIHSHADCTGVSRSTDLPVALCTPFFTMPPLHSETENPVCWNTSRMLNQWAKSHSHEAYTRLHKVSVTCSRHPALLTLPSYLSILCLDFSSPSSLGAGWRSCLGKDFSSLHAWEEIQTLLAGCRNGAEIFKSSASHQRSLASFSSNSFSQSPVMKGFVLADNSSLQSFLPAFPLRLQMVITYIIPHHLATVVSANRLSNT